MNDEFPTIITRAAEELGIAYLAEEERARIISSFSETVLKRLLVDITEALPENMRGELFAMGKTGNLSAVSAFIEHHIPNADEFIAQHIRATIEEIKKGARKT